MQILVKASQEQKATLLAMQWAEDLHWHWVKDGEFVQNADAYFDLCFEEEGWFFKEILDAPVFVNAVYTTAKQLPANAVRLNAWNSFLNRPVWEIAVADEKRQETVIQLLSGMGRKSVLVPDEPGLIAARVVAMIINEAYFAMGDAVSTKEAIDTAMKLGTNYPYGPFEWAHLIGLHRIALLLETCFKTDARYAISAALQQELEQQKQIEN